MKMPQLRFLVTSFCGRECVYCRPTGEGVDSCKNSQYADLQRTLQICELYKKYGGTEIKISGGDPIYWPFIVDFVKIAKNQIGMRNVELITRSPKIVEIIDELVSSGLDVLNFSLDTINPDTYFTITRCEDFKELIDAIVFCSDKIDIKINTVVMKDVNDQDIETMIDFCENNKIRQIKFLDIIDDMQDGDETENRVKTRLGISNLTDLYVSMNSICDLIARKSISNSIVYQGGLGHPMNEYVMPSGLRVTLKNSDNGAWYGKVCKGCKEFPCHDALMALRYTSDDTLQFCLLNEDTIIPLKKLDDAEVERVFVRALSVFENAYFIKKE